MDSLFYLFFSSNLNPKLKRALLENTMKHLLIICSLFAIGLTAPAFAQEDTASQESALEVAQDLEQALEVDEGRLKLNVNFEDDTSNDEKIKKVTDLLDNGGSASSLKSGLTLTAVGLGLVAAFGANGSGELVGFGLIPMFLGIARLIFWYLVERKNEPQTKENS